MKKFHTVWLLAALISFATARNEKGAPQTLPAQPQYDLLIRGGKIVDGAGNPWFHADVAITGERIARIGKLGANAKQVIDATGLIVCPGFIDMHSHSDTALLIDGNAESKIRQGVTTEILGEHTSAAPLQGLAARELGNSYGNYKLNYDWRDFTGYFARLLQKGTSVNVGSYVGGGQVRLCVMGADNRSPTKREMEEMRTLVDEAMRQGALGLSTGMIYPPNSYFSTEELIELTRAAAKNGGIYASHIRNEGNTLIDSIREAINIGEKAGSPVQIFHFKVHGKANWGRMPEAVRLIEEARSRGIDVSANQYPYVAGSTGLDTMLPEWAHDGGREKMLARIRDPEQRARMRKDIEQGKNIQQLRDWQSVQIARVRADKNKPYEGKTLAEAARMRAQDPADTVLDMLLEENGVIGAIFFTISEDDLRYALRQPWVSIGSDGTAVKPEGILGEGKPHPRWYGTFPRVLGRYVREEKALTLEDAIRKMTSLSAQQVGIRDRGLLQEGKYADVVVFDPVHVSDKATFSQPHQYSEGIEYVFVNGKVVLEKRRHTGARPGKLIYGPGKR